MICCGAPPIWRRTTWHHNLRPSPQQTSSASSVTATSWSGARSRPLTLSPWNGELHLDRPRALFVVSFIGPVAPRGGGTLILSGSPRLLLQQERRIPASQPREFGARRWDRFHRADPWLMALTGLAPSPADRIAAFMDRETVVEGVPLRVVELTGEPGDMVFCHPSWFTASARTGARGRVSCESRRRVLTHEGRELRDRLEGSPEQ